MSERPADRKDEKRRIANGQCFVILKSLKDTLRR